MALIEDKKTEDGNPKSTVPRFILWKKWNPMIRPNDDPEFIPEKDVLSFDNDPNKEEEEEDDGQNEGRSVIMTPVGIFPIKPWQDSSLLFNFWLGETSFDLDSDCLEIIDNMEGIEELTLFSRYKFRISVGNCFKFHDVKQRLEEALNAAPSSRKISNRDISSMLRLDESLCSQLKQLQVQLGAQYPLWAICVFPNQKLDLIYTAENSDAFQHKLEVYECARQLTHALILRYDTASPL